MGKYLASYIIAWQTMAEYRFAFFVTAFNRWIRVLALILIWTAVFAGKESVGGYSLVQFISYLIIAEVCIFLVRPNISEKVAVWIKNGLMNAFLVKPINYMKYWFAEVMAKRTHLFLVMLVPLILIASFTEFFAQTDPMQLTLFFVSLLLAIVTYFIFDFTVGLTGFWLHKVSSLNILQSALIYFLSGAMFPLSLLPQWAQTLSSVLPFQYFVYYPAQIYLGNITGMQAINGFFIEIIWLGIFYAVYTVVWNKGLKEYTGVGV